MKINKILTRFLQVLVLTGSGIFTAKTVAAEAKTKDSKASLNDRINLVREHIRNNSGSENLVANAEPRNMVAPPVNQIWINIVPSWNDWNKLWNDWSNWNNWTKWNDWGNFHRDYYRGDHGHDHDRGDHGHDRWDHGGHGHDHDHGHGR